MTKKCGSCNIEKQVTEFRRTKGGYLSRKCKECQKRKCKNVGCDYVVYGHSLCSKCCREKSGLGPRHRPAIQNMEAWLNQCLRSTKACSPARSKRGYRTKENDLTIEFLLSLLEKQNNVCAVSGIRLQSEYKNICSASIDRVDCEVGYLQTNVMLVCQWVNMGRNRTSIEDFKKILSNISIS